MEYTTAIRLQEEWGKKSCDHPRLERLYYAGAFLVSYVCTRCGADFTIAQKMEMDESGKKLKNTTNEI